jgi:2-dehydro-3-deoxyphosphogluconate aldolase/(4S)-4-hydroxy-2-oxoglutarate aldolase
VFDEFITSVAEFKIVPVIALDDPAKADDLAGALVAGGIADCRSDISNRRCPADHCRHVKRGDVTVGAGTVRNLDQAKAARDAGATFLVSPGFNASVVTGRIDQGLP